MMKKSQDKKKKLSSTTNLFLKVNEKNDKINLKFALNMYVPRGVAGSGLASPKTNETIKNLKLATATPKPKPIKKSVKENGYQTVVISNNNSYISTPFDIEPPEYKELSRNDYKFLYQVGSGGFGRVWKVQEKRSSQVLAMKEISKAKYICLHAGSCSRRASGQSSTRRASWSRSATPSSST